MATLSPQELLRLWAAEHLTSEMAIGHILQNLTSLESTIAHLQIMVKELQSERQSTSPPSRTPTSPAPKTPRRR